MDEIICRLLSISLLMVLVNAAAESTPQPVDCVGFFLCNLANAASALSPFSAADQHFGGWLNLGFTLNPAKPENNFNDTVGFSDRANELQLNQLYL